MRKITLLSMILLSGCATQYQAAGQHYRPKGSAVPVEITGQLLQKYNAFGTDHRVDIKFNGLTQINIPVDSKYFGEGSGEPFNGQPTSANCTGKRTSSTNIEIRCMVFIDNERTVTLTF